MIESPRSRGIKIGILSKSKDVGKKECVILKIFNVVLDISISSPQKQNVRSKTMSMKDPKIR